MKMQSFDPFYSSTMVGGIDYFHPLPPSHIHGCFPYSTEEDEQLLLDINGFLSDMNLPPHPDSDIPYISPHPSDHLYSNNTPAANYDLLDYTSTSVAADNYLQYFTPPDLHDHQLLPYQLDYDYYSLLGLQQQQKPLQHGLVESSADNYYLIPDHEPPPKRQKCFHPPYNSYSDILAPPPPPPHQFCACAIHVNGGGESRKNDCHVKGKELGVARATSQSIAARDRRKKISDKTLELGKLIPGAVASKMNTAEMLQNAFKYVKFMQSQLSLLQLLPSSKEEEKEQIKAENLQYVGSSAVQEKLYMKDVCLIPVDLLEQLANNGDLESQGSISTELKELIKSISEHNG